MPLLSILSFLLAAQDPTVPAPVAPSPSVPAAAYASSAARAPRDDTAARVVLEKVDLRDVPLADACRLIADQSGLNLVPSEGARATKVTLYLRDVAAIDAVAGLCRAHNLWYQHDETNGLVRIHTVEEYEQDLVGLQGERTECFTLLYPNALDVGFAVRNLFGDRVQLRTDDSESEVLLDLNDRFARFDVLDQRTQGFGTGLGGQGGFFGNGFEGGQQYGTNSYGNASGYGRGGLRGGYDNQGAAPETRMQPETRRLDLGAEQIQELTQRAAHGGDARDPAFLQSVARRLGSPINVSIARRQNKLLVRTGDEAALAEIRELVKRLDVPTALVLLEVRVLSIDLTDGMASFFDYQFADGDFAGAFTTGDIAPPVPPALGPGGTGLRGGDLVFQYVDRHFGARMQLLERDNRVRSISSPVLLTANNEVSRLFVGREVPLNRGFSGGQVVANESTTNTVSGSTAIEFRPVGTTLLITPNINADRTVTLRIVQETSNTDTTATVLVPAEDGFVSQTVPVVSSQSVSGTIVAKSELAVVFGGLIEEGVSRQKDQVPLLGDIPLIGVLFQRKSDVKTRREIVIMVRPYVLGTPSESEDASRRVLHGLGGDLDELMRAAGEADPKGKSPRTTRFKVHGVDEDEK